MLTADPTTRATDTQQDLLDLLVVIVCYRVPDMTIECLESLVPELADMPAARVAVLENGTGGDSAARIADAIERLGIGDQVTLTTVDDNLGFARGNNALLRAAIADGLPYRYVLLLNADTIVHPGCLRYCFDVMEQDPGIGAMSCLVLNTDRTPQTMARRFPSPLRSIVGAFGLPWRWPRLFGWADLQDRGWDRTTTTRDVEWLGGAFLWIRGSLMAEIGILDEDFVFYGEDVEYCHRVHRAGYRCRHAPGGSIFHLGGGSDDPVDWSDDVRGFHTWRSKYLVLQKCYGRTAAWLVRVVDRLVWRGRKWTFALTAKRDDPRRTQAARMVELLKRVKGSNEKTESPAQTSSTPPVMK